MRPTLASCVGSSANKKQTTPEKHQKKLGYLAALKGLTVFTIQGEQRTDGGIPHLARLTWLKKLDLNGQKRTDDAWNTLWDKLPQVESRR